jgi:hypothetical protein
MKLLKKNGRNEVVEIDGDFDELQEKLHHRFYSDSEVARYEETKYENGAKAVTIKNSGNLIIEQYKTL